MAFTCVNSTQWALVNGTLYMNSCGMYAGFMKDPAKDIAAASKLWKEWYGGVSTGPNATGKCIRPALINSPSTALYLHLFLWSVVYDLWSMVCGLEHPTGPINDACFQNGGLWDGPPDWTGNLIPDKCCIN